MTTLRELFGVEYAEDLSVGEASQLIHNLKNQPGGVTMIATAPTSPNQVAQRLTGRDYLSWFAISTYAGCPLRYYFRYVKRLPE